MATMQSEYGVARWMGTDHQRVVSWHATRYAAQRAAARYRRETTERGQWLGTIGVVEVAS